MVAACLNALPSGFYSKLTSPPTFDSWSAARYGTGYELCAVPPSVVDEYGCLRKGNKDPLVETLGVKLQLPDVVIVNAQQLMYHVIWSCGGIVESLNARLAMCGPAENILVFDRYDDVSAKDHERQRRTSVGSSNFNL